MSKKIAIFIALGTCTLLLGSEARVNLLKKEEKKNTKTNINKTKGNENEILKKMYEQNRNIEALLRQKTQIPYIWEGHSKILTGRVFKGTLLNSINSTNLASPVLVRADDHQGLGTNTKFSCFGTTAHKRVHVICNKLVTSLEEKEINAQILNLDGSSGLIGQYDDGKEDLIAGAIISDFTQGVLSASKSRFVTGIGEIEDSSVKNKVFEGLISSGQKTSEILLEEMKNREPIVTVKAGKKVLIYFQEKVNEN